jgi:hypothetical protein
MNLNPDTWGWGGYIYIYIYIYNPKFKIDQHWFKLIDCMIIKKYIKKSIIDIMFHKKKIKKIINKYRIV